MLTLTDNRVTLADHRIALAAAHFFPDVLG
jgi:hypothetical protein